MDGSQSGSEELKSGRDTVFQYFSRLLDEEQYKTCAPEFIEAVSALEVATVRVAELLKTAALYQLQSQQIIKSNSCFTNDDVVENDDQTTKVLSSDEMSEACPVVGDEAPTIIDRVDDLFVDAFIESGIAAGVVSELRHNIIQGDIDNGTYIVYIAPLDDPCNAQWGYPCGTLFGFIRYSIDQKNICKKLLVDLDVLQSGENLEFAGYAVYGARTKLVIAVRDRGLHQFTLDRNIGMFFLSKEYIKIPEKAQFYSADETKSDSWNDVTKQFFKTNISMVLADLSYYRPGGYVPIIHAIIETGGIFIDPETVNNLNGETPLLYYANPIALIMKEGNGLCYSSFRCEEVHYIKPKDIHGTVSLFCGSCLDVMLLKNLYLEQTELVGK